MAAGDGDASFDGSRTGLRVGVLGPLLVEYDGRRIEVTGVAGAVLALMSRTPGRVISVSAFVVGLWGDRPPTRPGKAVASYVARLRRALSRGPGDAGLAALVLTRAPGYILDVPPAAIDSVAFEEAVRRGRRAVAAGQPAVAAAVLRDGLALWRGSALEEYENYPFAQAESVRLVELWMSTLDARIDADLAAAAPHVPATLTAEVESLVAAHPYRERLWAQLMIALYRSGRQADALFAYQRARAGLVQDLGVEPGPGLRDTERAVLAADPHLLGDPIAAADLPSSLPGAGSVCIGRDEELERLAMSLDATACDGGRAVLVVAPAGYGKTQLLAEMARRAADRGVVCRYGRGQAALDALGADGTRLSLMLVDDVDELSRTGVERLAAWVRTNADRPVLTVAAAREVPEGLHQLSPLELPPLEPDAVEEVIRLYASAESPGAFAVAGETRGIPALVHDAASRWAAGLATGRVDRAVALGTEPRQRVGESNHEIVAAVLDLERVRSRTRALRGAREIVPCPYKGLARFESVDADLFHGRERLVAELIVRLVGAPLLAVVGASGSGKSSVVRAGLLPALAAGALPGSAALRQVIVTPSTDDITPLLGVEPSPTLLLVDQFEEIFTALNADRRTSFIAALMTAVGTNGTSVVVTLRSDFYGRCAEHRDLARLVAGSTVLVGPMAVDELRSAIERPAALAGLTLEDGLADRLIDDVREAPGGLPLLSTTLLFLWERRSGRTLTMAAYREIGGVIGAIAQFGERAYAELASDVERESARRMLLRLADSGGDHAVVRRRASRAEVESVGGPAASKVLDVLAARRLITVSEDDVDVSHEALLTSWPRLAGWLDEDAEGRRLRSHLSPVAATWAESGDAGELYRGTRLAAALEWSGGHSDELTDGERAFLIASEQAAFVEDLQRRRSVRRLRRLVVAAITALVLALVGSLVAVTQQRNAERSARIADARRLGAQALVEPDLRKAALLAAASTTLDDSPQTTGYLLATLNRSPQLLAAAGVGEGRRLLGLAVSPDGSLVAVSTNDQLIQVYRVDTMRLVAELKVDPRSGVNHLDFTPDGRSLLALGMQEVAAGHGLQVWQTTTWRAAGPPFGPSSYVRGSNMGGGILPDGSAVVTADSDGTLGVWNLSNGQVRVLLSPAEFQPAGGTDVIVGPDRRTVVLNGTDGAWIVDAMTGTVRHLPTIAGVLAVSPDARTLLAKEANGDLGVWDVETGTRRGTAQRHTTPVLDAVWSPDGRTFASTAEDRLTVVWDAETLRPREVLVGAAGRQLHVRYTPDGRTLFTAGQDGGLYAWDLTRRRGLEVELHPTGTYSDNLNGANIGPVVFDFPRDRAIVFESATASAVDLRTGERVGQPFALGHDWYRFPSLSADGRRLSVGFADGHGRVWDLGEGRLLLDIGDLSIYDGYSTDPAFDQQLVNTVISSDGKTVVFAGYRLDRAGPNREPEVYSAVINIYDVDTGSRNGDPWIIERTGHNGLAISPDGRLLAAALGSSVGIWDIARRRQVALMTAEGEQGMVRFSPDGRYLASGAMNGRVSLFRTWSWEPAWRAEVGHNGPNAWVSFSPDGRVLATSGADSKIFLYDVATGAPIGRALGPDTQAITVLYATFRPDRNEIVGYFANGAMHSWDLNPAAWKRRACAIAGRDITKQEWERVLPGRPYRSVCNDQATS